MKEGTIHNSSNMLDRASDVPLWQQLAQALRSEIESGNFRAEQALPSESELIDRHGVSRTVVREALAELVRAGLIYKIRARGSFVSPQRPELRFIGSTAGSSDDLSATGRNATTSVLALERGVASETEATALGTAVSAPVIRVRRLRRVDGVPWLLVDTVLPFDRFPGLVRANLENKSLYEHLRRHFGVSVRGADRWLSAIVPTDREADLLELPSGQAVLEIESVAWDETGVPFERYRALHRSDGPRFYVGIR